MMGCFLCSGESARRKVISSSIENRPRLNDYEKLQLDSPKVSLPKSSKDPKASPPKYVKDRKASPSPPRSVKDNKTSPSPPKYVKDAKLSSPVAVKNTRPSPPKYVKDIRASPPNNTVRAPKPSLPKYAKDPKPIPTPPKYVKDLKAGKPKYVKENPQVVNQSGMSPCNGEPKPNVPGARTFPFDTLVSATQNFKAENFLGAGGFGEVYKGCLPDTGEIVAVKQLDRNGCQGIREFMVEVLTLSMAKHSNLVKLIGYCAEGDQRLLVYEFMPLGSLEDHLHGPRPSRKALDWNARMKIAAGAAQGLEYLHDKMTKPIIYRDLKCSNILLGEGYDPKLSDFGLAKVGPSGDETHVSTRVMGTYGYCAPDYAMTGQLTFKSDIYSFGVVLLEIITGRRAIDNRRSGHETNLVAWAKPLFKDRKKFHQMADPALEGRYPVRGLYQALAIAAMCVQEQPSMRPLIADVVTALNFLACQKYDPDTEPTQRSSGRSLHSLRSKSDGDLEHIAVTTDERTI